MRETFNLYKKALKKLTEILKKKETDIIRDASIQRFEFAVELAWKVIQKYLKDQGITCRSPKECLKEAFQYGLIEDNPLWIEMLNDRNLTVHTYNEKTAIEIYKRMPRYLVILDYLKNNLSKKLD